MSRFTPQELTILDPSPLSSSYAETFVYAPSGQDEENLGYLYVAAEVYSNKTKKENAELLAEISAVMKNEYYRNTIVTPMSALRFTLKRTNNFLASQKKWLAPAAGLKLKIIVGSLKDKDLHLARLGDAAAMILRNDNLQRIIPPASAGFDATSWTFENIVSGELMAEDRIVLATNQIHRVDSEELAYKLKNKKLVEYLKASGDGIKNLALITLEPNKLPLMPLVEKGDKRDEKGKRERKKLKPTVLILILAAAVVATTAAALKIRNETAGNKKEAEGLLQEITDLNSKIPALIEVKNETEASELLKSAREKITRLEELGYFKTTRLTLERELAQTERGLKRVEEVDNIRRVVELENNSTGFEPADFALGRNKILIYGGNTVYRFDLNRREGSFVSTDKNQTVVSILEKPGDPNSTLVVTQDQITTIALDAANSKNIWSRSENDPILKQAAVYSQAFYLLGNNNLIYKLPFEISSTTNEILTGQLAPWTNNQEATSDPSTSLGAGKRHVTSFAVEGSIFALTENNKIFELANGELKSEKELSEKAIYLFTGSAHKNIYLLSSDEGLITVLDKNLNAITRYSHPELRGAVAVAVNSQEKVIYFLKGKTVYSFEI